MIETLSYWIRLDPSYRKRDSHVQAQVIIERSNILDKTTCNTNTINVIIVLFFVIPSCT